MNWLRPIIILCGLVTVWQIVIWLTQVEHFILPAPAAVAGAIIDDWDLLLDNAGITLAEIIIGLILGVAFGCLTALTMAASARARVWVLPVVVASQAIPVFALAPLLVVWFGFGLWSKVAMAMLIIYFPVAAAFYDGLRRTDPGWLDIAHTMQASRWSTLRHIRVPAALPALGSGMRVAAAVAPIGAIIGEWVGASAGLGHLMTQANARNETPRMYAALIILAVVAVALYFLVDRLTRRLTPWQAVTDPSRTQGTI
jgi:putative hydroxymethylpyrimidine transport system permease protein